MAFVVKSKKGFDPTINNTTQGIGPGEYISQSNYSNIKASKEPFLVGEKRSFIKELNDNPGPGAYYKDDVLIKCMNNIQREKMISQNILDDVAIKNDIKGYKKAYEKLGFNIKAKRFKNKQLNEDPGPGSYFPKIISEIKKSNSLTKKKEKIIYKIPKEIFSNIPSIPAKNKDYGFEINKKTGKLTKKENPNMYKTFTGLKGDSVGPGSYEVDCPDTWHKAGTEWSKFKETRDGYKPINSSSNILDDNQKISMQTTRYSDNKNIFGRTTMTTFKLEDRNTVYSIISNDIKNDQNLNKIKENEVYIGSNYDSTQMLNDKKNIMNVRNSIIKRINQKEAKKDTTYLGNIDKFNPGPGYYFGVDKQTSFKRKRVPEFKQFFGSKSSRFKKTKDDGKIGPATYFQVAPNDKDQKIKEEKNSRINRQLIPFSTKTERFKKPKKSVSPGPGQYSQKSQFAEKLMNRTFNKFGTNEIRFMDDRATKWKNEIPGPGSYMTFYNFGKDKKFQCDELKAYRYTFNKFRSNSNDENIQFIKNRLQLVRQIPPVGQYNSDVIFSINYNNIKKIRNNANIPDVAFNSSLNQRLTKTSISNVGPGYYYKEHKIKNKQVYPAFKSGSKKFIDDNNSHNFISPGLYNLDSYFDWNKRTYNVNFI